MICNIFSKEGAHVDVHAGEIYGKQTANKFIMYSVLKIGKSTITLQNIDNPLSLFETSTQKLLSSGYLRISQTPYVNMQAPARKRRKVIKKPVRCPYTLDFIEDRADCERPTPIYGDLFDASEAR